MGKLRKAYKRATRAIEAVYGKSQVMRHGFWFVDIPKTSSSSIRVELGNCFGRVYGKKRGIGEEHRQRQIFLDHRTADEMVARFGKEQWNSLFTFTVVRNPWDRILSMYNYRKRISGGIPGEWNFRDYVFALDDESMVDKYFKPRAFRYGASDYLLGEDGEILVDYIAKYENRSKDLEEIARRLNFPALGKLCILKASPEDKHYTDFYENKTREIIRRRYSKDIELFEYEYGD